MIKITLILNLVLLGQAMAQQQLSLQLVNPLEIPRADELIIIERASLEKHAGAIATGFVPIIKNAEGIMQPSQCDDLNKDGEWDEFVFLCSLDAKGKATFTLSIIESNKMPAFTQRAHVRMRKKLEDGTFGKPLTEETMPSKLQANNFNKNPIPLYQTEGPAWENDKVAFRLYFDVRNAKDIFGKTASNMMMDSIGLLRDNYHQQAPWGMDILKVGTSLGAGALAFGVKTKTKKDSLVRLGGDIPGKVTYRCISDGPIRALFELRYENCSYHGKSFSVAERISIAAGTYNYESQVSMKGDAVSGIATGIVNLKTEKYSMETISGVTMLSTFGKQSENNDNLGMAILTKEKKATMIEMPESGKGITQTYALLLGMNSTFRFYSGWEVSDKRFSSQEGFQTYLQEEAARWQRPIVLQMIRAPNKAN
jgi:hypothetical protein